jgi:WS/DGAT/MGAT family acyltransferase
MASHGYEPLGAQDAAFLAAEGPNTPMHVAAVFVAESGPLHTSGGGVAIARIRDHISARLHLIPRYRQRLAWTPLRRAPIWVDDEHFSIEYHVRHTSLPKPGSPEQLRALVARITELRLARGRPLWETWVVEGLDEGNSFAMVTKVHHCMIDGMAGAELMTVLMSPSADEPSPQAPAYVPRPALGPLELVRAEGLRLVRGPLDAIERVQHLLGSEKPGERLASALRGAAHFIGQGMVNASETPLNHEIGPHRRFEYFSQDLEAVRDVKNKLGGTINDVVLATVAGGLRRFLTYRRVDVSKLNFRASTPVSMRSDDEQGMPGNRVSAWLVPLPLDEPDPLRRLERLRETTAGLKQSDDALGADLLSAVTEWTGTTLLSLGMQLQNLARLHNVIVTNVPGPQMPLYMVGARLSHSYPIVPLFRTQALGIALFSYDGKLDWGLNADSGRVPDLPRLRRDLEESFAELQTAAGLAPSGSA